MKIQVLFFGRARELAGTKSMSLEVPVGLSVGRLREVLAHQFTGLDNGLNYAVAVNEVYCGATILIHADDIVAILPPVSGG